jgi:hypothetical protein
MAIEMRQEFGVAHWSGDRCTGLIDQDGGCTHDITAGACSVSRLDGVAGRAGDALILKGALLRHALGKVTRQQGDRIVAPLTVPGILHALLVDEHVDVFQIPRSTEAIGVH